MPVKHVLLKFDQEEFDRIQATKPDGWSWEKFVLRSAEYFKRHAV